MSNNFYTHFFEGRIGSATSPRSDPRQPDAQAQLHYTINNLGRVQTNNPLRQDGPGTERATVIGVNQPLRPCQNGNSACQIVESYIQGIDGTTHYSLQFNPIHKGSGRPAGEVNACLWRYSPDKQDWDPLYNLHASRQPLQRDEPIRQLIEPDRFMTLPNSHVLHNLMAEDVTHNLVFDGRLAYKLLHRFKNIMVQSLQILNFPRI